MYFSEIKKTDIANGTGVRVTLFVSGCRRHCKNCFNSETWSFTNGKPFTDETQRELLDALNHSYINGLTLLGGEPMEIENQRALLPFLRRVRAGMISEIQGVSERISAFTGAPTRLFRPPYGDWDLSLLGCVRDCGQIAVLWSVDARAATWRIRACLSALPP